MIHNANELVRTAYKKLKQIVYFDKSHLAQRKRLAEFECANDFEERLQRLVRLINTDDEIARSDDFRSWLEDIDYILVPKGGIVHEKRNKDQGTYVSNVTSNSKYMVEKVNYLFDGPIEIHLLAVLWLMVEGQEFDRSLSSHCLGSRLHKLVGEYEDRSAYLFQKYHELYSKWRDDGIRVARHLLTNEGQSVSMLALDVQEYYYRIQIDWRELRAQVERSFPDEIIAKNFQQQEILGMRLFDCVEAICRSYHKKIQSLLDLTHDDLPNGATCLPIGLCASPVIANWYLKEFDEIILKKIRPAYYGRYIDDIFLVIASEVSPKGDDHIKEFMSRLLVDSHVLKWHEKDERFEFVARPGLFLQKRKCILQYFDAEHSIAGLDKFQKQIESNASDFALLPLEGDESPVAQVAYDILYDGSVNKFRSVKSIGENRWELARHLARQTQLHLLTEGKIAPEMKTELFHFFKGRSAIDYWDMWERVIGFFLVADTTTTAEKFCKAMQSEINRTDFDGDRKVSAKLRSTLNQHLKLCMDLTKAVRTESDFAGDLSANIWRKSNLIRHHLVAIPLLNFTNFGGDLTEYVNGVDLEVEEWKAVFSPRFVHFEECLAFYDSGCGIVSEADSITLANHLYARFHGAEVQEVKGEIVQREGEETK